MFEGEIEATLISVDTIFMFYLCKVQAMIY